LREVPDESGMQGSGAPELLGINIFCQVLFKLASKSFSHTFAAIAKFHPLLKALCSSEEAQIAILKTVFEMWKKHQQFMVVIVDKLLKTQIVECASVANWIFSKDMLTEFTKGYTWEMLHLTIRKMNKHVGKLSKEATEARRMIEESDSDSDNDSANEDDMKERSNKRSSNGGNRDKTEKGEKPTEEHVEKLEERLEAAQADQKNLFLIIFQRFIMILSEHLVRCDTDGMDFKSPWYMWTVGRLQQIFMMHHEQVEKYSTTLETLLFTADLDPNVLDVFQQFTALRM